MSGDIREHINRIDPYGLVLAVFALWAKAFPKTEGGRDGR